MICTVTSYLNALLHPQGVVRSLGRFELCRDERGEVCRIGGNSAVVFKIRVDGELKMLKCYTRYRPHLRQIYGDDLLEEEHFGKFIDDYPLALISVALKLLSLDPALGRGRTGDRLVFTPDEIFADRSGGVYSSSLDLLARNGCAAHYRLARMLRYPTVGLGGVRRLFRILHKVDEAQVNRVKACVAAGLWGFELDGEMVVEHIYDEAFDFSDGVAAVKVGRYCHFVDIASRVVINCSRFDFVKPFRGGEAVVEESGVRRRIDLRGCEVE